jgi:cytidylate kinase
MVRIPVYPSFDARIRAQAELWRRQSIKKDDEKDEVVIRPFVTISRQFGCPAYDLSEKLAKVLNERGLEKEYIVYDRKLLEWISDEDEVSTDLVKSLTERTRSEIEDVLVGLFTGADSELKILNNLAKAITAVAAKGNAIIVGRGGAIFTNMLSGGIHIRLIAPIKWRLEDYCRRYPDEKGNVTIDEFHQIDRDREGFIKKYLGSDLSNPKHFHATLNVSKLSLEDQVEMIATLVK